MRDKKKMYRTISIVSFLVMLISLIALAGIFMLYRWSDGQYQELARLARGIRAELTERTEAPVSVPEEAQPESTPVVPVVPMIPEESPEPELAAIPVDFDYLREINPDIIAWILVDGTEIDYPVLYDSTQERFYLSHNYAGAYTMYGSIFMLSECRRDFANFNSVIYGHNMLDGRMFAQLHRFEKQDFFDAHDSILIYTPDRVLEYRIFAAYMTDKLNQIVNFDDATPETRQAYIDRIFSHETRAIFREGVRVTPDDRIVTLSTCIGNPANRYLVQGVLVSEQPGVFVPQSEENHAG